MNHQEFQQRYEDESDLTFTALSNYSEDQLLETIEDKRGGTFKIWDGGDNYTIWRVFKTKGTSRSIKPLFDIVSNLQNKYLIRYHACDALFAIANIQDDGFKGEVQFGRDANRNAVDQQAAIDLLRTLLKLDNA